MESFFPSHQRTGSRIKKEMRAAKKKRWWRGERLGSSFKNIDIYGEQVQLTYKGNSTFKSIPGAIISSIVLVTLISFSIHQSLQFVLRQNPNVSTQNFMTNLD